MHAYFLVLVNTCGLMAVCTVVYSYAQARIAHQGLRRAAVGLAFGLAGILAMMQPLEIEPGLFADARGVFVGMAMAFGGPVAAGIAMLLTASARLAIGGPGAILGATVIVVTGACAGLWLVFHRHHQDRTRWSWVTLTLACAAPTFIALYSLPQAGTWLGVFLSALMILVVFSFGKLLNGEQRRGRRERMLAEAAATDMLTSLPNRRAFDEYAQQLEASGADDVMLLLLDVDNFKSINDELGHDSGDQVLRGIAQAIRKTIRASDFAARIGGEEFAVIVRTRDEASGHQIAERFRHAVQVAYGAPEAARLSTVSVGGFCFNGKPFTYASAYRKADEALYQSKREGRNRVTLAPYLQVA